MLSTCPSCLSQVFHQDHLSEVTCDCGTTFPTILEVSGNGDDTGEHVERFSQSDDPEISSDNDFSESPFGTVLDPSKVGDGDSNDFSPHLGSFAEASEFTPEPDRMGEEKDYSESTSVFEEIRNFGETLNMDAPQATDPAKSTPPSSSPPPLEASGAKQQSVAVPGKDPSTPVSVQGEKPITAGDILNGYSIDAYLMPVSAICVLDVTRPDPMKAAFESLWTQAAQKGGNAVVAVRWSFLPDGSKVLLSGTAVRCTKKV